MEALRESQMPNMNYQLKAGFSFGISEFPIATFDCRGVVKMQLMSQTGIVICFKSSDSELAYRCGIWHLEVFRVN